MSRNAHQHPRRRASGDAGGSSKLQQPARDRLAFLFDAPRPSPPAEFLRRAAEYGITFEPGELDRYAHYLALLLANNAILNLTAITDPDEAWHRHVLDSLTLLPILESEETPMDRGGGGGDLDGDLADEGAGGPADGAADGAEAEAADGAESGSVSHAVRRVCDIGSGGGAPGLILAIARPDIGFTLVEATAKKAQFIEFAIEQLALTNAVVINARAEEVGANVAGQGPTTKRGAPKPLGLLHRAAYDIVTARAVGRIAVVAEWCVPLARINGRIALIKGERAVEELAEAKAALHLLHTHHVATLDTPTGKIVVLEKTRKTPALYPRKVGEAKRRPLGTQD